MYCSFSYKKTFCILLLLVSTLLSENYYVSKSYGNNNNDGKSVNSPFKTIAKAASVMTAGDICYIREGSYHEIITINNKDGSQGSPIVFTRYNNERVILDGTLPIDTSWTVHSGNIYKKKLSFTPWQLFVGGLEQIMARWPNAKFSDESIWDNDNHWAKGTIDDDENAYSNGTMIDDPYTNDQGESINLSSQGFNLDQTNKEAIAILNTGSFRTWSRKVTSHSGGTFNYATTPGWKTKHHYYYLEGRLEFLDSAGEWFFDTADSMLYLWPENNANPKDLDIRGKVQSYAFNITASEYIHIKNLEFFATTVYFYNGDNSLIYGCNFMYPSCSKRMLRVVDTQPELTLFTSSSTDNIIRKSAFRNTDGSVIEMWGGDNMIDSCYFNNIDYSVADNSSIMLTIRMNGSDNTFSHNTIHKTGASATVKVGNSGLVEYNNLYDTGHLQSDGSMIQFTEAEQDGAICRYNWLHDTEKYGARFDHSGSADGVNGLMHHNVAWNCQSGGIMVKGNNHKIYNNTVINSGKKNDIIVLKIGSSDHSGTIVKNNVAMKIANHRSNDVEIDFGSYSNNWNGYKESASITSILSDTSTKDLTPKSGSSIIDAGVAISGITDGYQGSNPDMGAYESGAASWTAGHGWDVNSIFGSQWVDLVESIPTITGSSINATNDQITVTFSESVFNDIASPSTLEAADFSLSLSGGVATLSSSTPTSLSSSGNNYILGFTLTGTPNGAEVITISPVNNSIFDSVGNTVEVSQNNNIVTLNDKLAPSVEKVSSLVSNGSFKAGDQIPLLIKFSEDVNVNGTPKLTLEAGSTDKEISFTSGSGTDSLIFSYTVAAGENSNGLDYISQNALILNSGAIKDSAGNNANLILPTPGQSGSLSSTKNFIIDTVAPTISISAKNSTGSEVNDGAVTNNDSLLITFTISEAASNFTSSDISISGGQLSSFTAISSTVYTAIFKPSSEGETTIDVATNAFTDGAGNNNIASSQFNWSFDNVAPTISSVNLLSDNSAIEILLSETAFSQNNGSGLLEISDFQFSIAGGTATLTSTNPTSLNKNGNAYILTIGLSGTPDGNEQLTISLLSNSAYDAIGNVLSVNDTKTIKLNDQTKPVIGGVNFASDNSYADITFSVPVYSNNNGTGALELSDFIIVFSQSNGTATAASMTSIKKDNSTNEDSANNLIGGESIVRIFISITGTPNGNEEFSIKPRDANSIYDLAGNSADVDINTSSTKFQDRLAPIISITPSNNSTQISLDSIIVLSFNEPIRQLNDLEINNNNVKSLISLNRTESNGVSLDFLSAISSDKKTITIDPVLDFNFEEKIHLTFQDVEDHYNNPIGNSASSSFTSVKNIKPIAQTQTILLAEDSSISIQLTGSDSEGYDLSYGRSNVKNGTLTGFLPNVIYTPDSNFFGADSFKFVTNDGFINSDSATISILVNAVNDKPILSLSDMDTLSLTQKQSEAFIFPPNHTKNGITSSTTIKDIDDDYISKSVVTISPYFSNEDTLVYSDNSYPKIIFSQTGSVATYEFISTVLKNDYPLFLSKIKYVNNAGYNLTKGKRIISIKIADDEALSDSNEKIIELNILNSAPIAISFNDTLLEDTKTSFSLQGSDIDPDQLSFFITKKFTKGRLVGTLPNLTYVPDENFFGHDKLKYVSNDGKISSDTATIDIVVLPVNDPPTDFSLKNPSDSGKVVITNSNVDLDVINFDWHQSQDVDNKELIYLLSGEFRMIDIEGNNIVHKIDTLTNATILSLTYRKILDILDTYPSARGTIDWKVNVTDGQDTIYNRERRSLIIEGQYAALSINDENTIPKEFSLHDNYPNPFNPVTKIAFDMRIKGDARLIIYNIMGQKIKEYQMRGLSAGYHSLTWDANNSFGQPVSAGIYFYRFETKTFTKTKRMLLLK
tara:strand:+ start:2174 stop:7858 length:5685 start_codon:yes stop_codon:yes gene_type:complete